MQSPAQKTRHQFNASMSDSISDMKFCVYLTRNALTASSLRCLFCFVLFCFIWAEFSAGSSFSPSPRGVFEARRNTA